MLIIGAIVKNIVKQKKNIERRINKMAFFSGLGASILAGLGISGGVSSLTASAVVGTAAAAGIAGAAGVGIAQAGKVIDEMTQVPESSSSASSSSATTETAAESLTNAQQTATAVKQDKLKRASRSRSIFSSPLGIGGEATTVKKSLLGQ